jgi:uncharacterized sulfatase
MLADDFGWWSAGTYGDPNLKTPYFDKLAEQGMRFEYAFANCPVCTPCRCALGSGVYPIRSRIWSNATLPRNDAPGLKSIADHLMALGYRVGLYDKTDVGPFDLAAKANCQVNPEKFIKERSDRPFFLVHGSKDPHVPWTRPARLSPEKITVPPMLVDNAETRRALCDYYAAAGHFDELVGRCLGWVEEAGLTSSTVLIVAGEQGAPFPRGKWTCCDDGLRSIFLVRWPGKIKPGSQSKALIQYIDVAPTLVEIAGGDPAACDTGIPGAVGGGSGFDGQSFLDVLVGKKSEHHRFVYGAYTLATAIRSVRDDRFLYIANLRSAHLQVLDAWADAPPADRYGNLYGFWKALDRDASTTPLASYILKMCRQPPPEEFYDVINDPHQLKNLADDPQYRQECQSLKKQLDRWRVQYGDDKLPPAPSSGAKRAATERVQGNGFNR